MKRRLFFLVSLSFAFALAACDSDGDLDPPITGTWVSVDTVDIFSVGDDPVEGVETRTYVLSERDDRIEGTYSRVVTTASGVFFSEEGLRVTGSYDFPDVSLTVYDADGTERETRTGTMEEDGTAIDFPLNPDTGALPYTLERQ